MVVDFSSCEVVARLEDIRWGCTTDWTQSKVLSEGLHSAERTMEQCNQ